MRAEDEVNKAVAGTSLRLMSEGQCRGDRKHQLVEAEFSSGLMTANIDSDLVSGC